ncbi:secondary thiamine-phosphate synthase enzyme YjbQ [Peredibacter starrii]|uniref:Secondary thiamine-phosphate synthase enzyme YjbQ n=1 Tax=Peredibacter starrii TaxID=28202 RepID=A0AAX4HSV3_9BACT|nr:secondary thiamine-phosphate synthase enzyme YjbQ [Peredibacter starrii]WPU66045.1 secondary thiamine-phosphate synthase enzyme YjbQ [Peredibacter starrii]
MTKQFFLTLPVFKKGFHIITDEVLKAVGTLPDAGLLHVFILHTSAGLAVNENADQTVRHDMDRSFDELAPENQPFYQHTVEGPDDMPAHIKSLLVGSSVTIPITNGKLNLGTWQGIYLCEFRKNATPRKLVMTVLS